jgi:hypothetical protein
MARVLTDLGLMREQGEGIPRIFEEMEEVLLPLPEMVEADRRFVLTLRNTPIFDAPDEPWVRTVAKLNLSARQRRALVAFVDKGAFQNRDYCELNRVDRDTAYAEMKELVDRGLLRADGKKYRVVRSVPVEDQPSSERLLAQRLEARGYVQNADYRDAFGVDRHEALRGLGELVDRGVLVREGERRGARYIPGPHYTRWCEDRFSLAPKLTALRAAWAGVPLAERRVAVALRGEVRVRASQSLTTAVEAADAALSLFEAEVQAATVRSELARATLNVRRGAGRWPVDAVSPIDRRDG